MINDIIQAWGIANPQISVAWTVNGKTTPATAINTDNNFQLTCNAPDKWVAPVSGILLKNDGVNFKGFEKIVMSDGSSPASGLVLRIFQQVYATLTRLYGGLAEGQALADSHKPERPVPCYFVFTNVANPDNAPVGYVTSGTDLLNAGKMSIHDINGLPIDPLAVAATFDLFVQKFASIESKALNSNPPTPAPPFSVNRQLTTIANLAGTNASTRIHLITPYSQPFIPNGALPFNNVTAVNAATGLYTINTVTTAINKININTPNIKIGAATFGLLNDSYTIRPLATGITLRRDFFRAMVLDLAPHLIGNTPATEPSAIDGQLPVVRDNEQITFSFSGNQCLGSINAMMSDSPSINLLVSPVIDSDFNLPPATANEWPVFPVLSGTGSDPVPIPHIRESDITSSAHFIQDPANQNTDVVLTISASGFSNGNAIRVYTRIFHPDGTETRGDGAGGIINGTTATVRLRDPFNLIRPFTNVVIPVMPDLMYDLVIINRSEIPLKRSIGLITTAVAAPLALTAVEVTALGSPSNTLNTLNERGISPAGISGFSSLTGSAPAFTNIGDFLLNSIGEAQPRRAARYPTMARNDSMAAARKGTTWVAQLSGLVTKKDALQNLSRLANPGSPGGEELHTVALNTQNGLLAYDIARAAYRRTRHIAGRMFNLIQNNNWNVPAAPSAGAGTFAAATLQTIAKGCESPELSLFPQGLAIVRQKTPQQLATDLTDLVSNNLAPSWLPASAVTAFRNAMTGLGTNPNAQAAHSELMREYVTSVHGRKDAFWALKNALVNARECIYIQGTFFGDTHYPTSPSRSGEDFIEIIKTRLNQNKSLKVILCLSQKVHYGKGYETFAAREYAKRDEAIKYLGNVDRVVAFHPSGYPQRPKQQMTNVIIVDDIWAMIGTSNFRRRGLMFDGGQDVALTDRKIVNGKSSGISTLRQILMSDHLLLQNQNSTLPITNATQVRLNDAQESFFVFKELLEQGGAGLIRRIWTGDLTDISSPAFPSDDVADPNQDLFDNNNQTLRTALISLSTVAPL